MNYVVGIDIGTSCCKTVLLNEAGKVATACSEEYPLYQPRTGWFEQEPDDWWEAVCRCGRRLMQSTAIKPEEIKGISFAGQMHSMVALDENGKVIRPAILWNDQRNQSQCDRITEMAGGIEGLVGLTNNRMLAGYTAGKLVWLRENEPESYAKVAKVLNPKDYIRYRFTGLYCTEVSDASGTGLFDVRNRKWSTELMKRMGLPEHFFPDCVDSFCRTGEVSERAARESGFAPGTPVFGGGGDAVISMADFGSTYEGKCFVSLGTSGVVSIGTHSYTSNEQGKLQFFCGVDKNSWVSFGCTLSAANSYKWLRDTIRAGGRGLDYRHMDRLAKRAAAGSDGLLFFPYLDGERCPHYDPFASGGFLGIRSSTKGENFIRATMEGVAYSLKQVFEIVSAGGFAPAKEIYLNGGGAKSPFWCQIIADVFEMPVVVSETNSAGAAMSAAIIAGKGAKVLPEDFVAPHAQADRGTVYYPTEENRGIYRKSYALFCKYAGNYCVMRDEEKEHEQTT